MTLYLSCVTNSSLVSSRKTIPIIRKQIKTIKFKFIHILTLYKVNILILYKVNILTLYKVNILILYKVTFSVS